MSIALNEFTDRDFRFVMVLAAVMISAGAAEYFHGSPILAALVAGVTFANILPELGERTRGLIDEILSPLFVLFFVLVGVSAHIGLLMEIGLVGLVYVAVRTLGKVGGGFAGATIVRAPKNIRNYFGVSMLSQAGVAVGLALALGNEVPAYSISGVPLGEFVVTIVAATSIFFELLGPVCVRIALTRTGEAHA